MDAASSSPHPTDQALKCFGLGKLDKRGAEAVNKHVEQCSDCRERVAVMSSGSFLNDVRDSNNTSCELTGWPPKRGKANAELQLRLSSDTPAGTTPPVLEDHPNYEIKRELGRGGMGVVYLAHNRLMGRDEVLKVMSRAIMERPGVLERFLREIRAVGRLRHENIVTAYTAFWLDQSIVFAMEYVDGLDLSRIIKSRGPLTIAHACLFAHQTATGLQHAHEAATVHRDIKPANLMLSRQRDRPIVKILDFGLARATSEAHRDLHLTQFGQMLGTPDFMAPEQWSDAATADIRADIYSLGCTLYQLLSGSPPFCGKTIHDLFQAHHSSEARRLNFSRPEVPTELAALVATMMAKQPDRRFQTPKDVADALTPFLRQRSAEFKSPAVEVSRTEPMCVSSPPVKVFDDPNQPTTDSDASPSSAHQERKSQPVSLDEFRESEAARNPEVEGRRRRPWAWTAAAIGVSLFGISAAWLSGGLRVKTPNGVIVLENFPEDAEVFVDRDKVSLSWSKDDGPIELSVRSGKRGIEVKKHGLKLFGEEITIDSGARKSIRLRLDPPKVAATAAATQYGRVPAKLTLKGHSNDITHLLFSPDGSRLFSASNGDHYTFEGRVQYHTAGTDNGVRAWNVETGEQVRKFAMTEGHHYGPRDISISADGRFLAISSGWLTANGPSEPAVYIYNIANGRRRNFLTNHPNSPIRGVGLAPTARAYILSDARSASRLGRSSTASTEAMCD